MYTVTESTKRNDEYFDFVKELDLIKGRRLKCSGGCKIYSGGGESSGGGRADRHPPPEYATVYTYMYVKVQPTCSLGRIYVYIMYIFTKNTNCYI